MPISFYAGRRNYSIPFIIALCMIASAVIAAVYFII
jgi:hypothetical protein